MCSEKVSTASGLGRAYQSAYDWLAGAHPFQRPWHFQWSGVEALHSELRPRLADASGRVLDVGCGQKPYQEWFTSASQYIGIDVYDSGNADRVIEPDGPFPFGDEEFDVVVAFEVIEHVEDLQHTLAEMVRVLRPGGRLILTFPFLYNEHGAPSDFRRISRHGALTLFSEHPAMSEEARAKALGGVGSSLAIVLLNWLETATNGNRLSRMLKGLLLPLWVVTALLVNAFGKLLDYLDSTGAFYHHVILEVRKSSS